MSAFVKFWGTRGSIPTPSGWTRVYGGNTACVEIRFDDTLFICDAGSGIRELGKDLVKRTPKPQEVHLFISHTHWDHIQGFPFFVPAYSKQVRIHVYGDDANDDSQYRLLSGQMSSDYFPVSFRDLGAEILCEHFVKGEVVIDGVRVRSFRLNHTGGCSGFVFEKDGRKIVFATDNELVLHPEDKFPDLDNDGPLRRMPEELVELMRDADLLILDAQYDDEQYATKRGWGHSSCFSATDLAVQAGAKHAALFHHDPESTDRDVDVMVKACWQRALRHRRDIVIFGAREGIELKF